MVTGPITWLPPSLPSGAGPGEEQQEGERRHGGRPQQAQEDLRQDTHQHPAPKALQVNSTTITQQQHNNNNTTLTSILPPKPYK